MVLGRLISDFSIQGGTVGYSTGKIGRSSFEGGKPFDPDNLFYCCSSIQQTGTILGLQTRGSWDSPQMPYWKILAFAMTAYAPKNNNFQLGGEAFKVLLERADAVVKAKQTSYKRQYRENGTYHYPKEDSNISRRAGDEYFQNHEITGSNEGTANNPKFSLLKLWTDLIIPALDELARELSTKLNNLVIIINHWDNATPHKDKTLLKFINEQCAPRRRRTDRSHLARL